MGQRHPLAWLGRTQKPYQFGLASLFGHTPPTVHLFVGGGHELSVNEPEPEHLSSHYSAVRYLSAKAEGSV